MPVANEGGRWDVTVGLQGGPVVLDRPFFVAPVECRDMDAPDVPVRVDHVGIAVPEVAVAEPVLLALGCEKIVEETLSDRFTWAYYRLGDASRIELIEPAGDETFLTRFLDEHGPGLHHVTLEVGDIDTLVAHLEAIGLRIVDYTTFDDWTEAFVSPRNPTKTLFQLMEYHDSFEETHPPDLFVHGQRVGEADRRPSRGPDSTTRDRRAG